MTARGTARGAFPLPSMPLHTNASNCVPGRELHAALKAKRVFGEVETKVISSQILSALVYLHMHGIVHRDVTPRNILVAASGRATLIDLGLAINIQVQQ